MSEVIAFHVNHFSLRGSEVAVYDYAHYNEEILHNKSFIVVHNKFRDKKDYRGVNVHNEGIYKKFNTRFTILEYSNISNLQQLLIDNKTTIFYNLKSGENDNFIIPGVKNVNHCVFTYDKNHVHGDVYIPISPAIVDPTIRSCTPHVPHIVNVPNVNGDLREFLNIPKNAIVFGRHGGEESFNIPFVHEVVQQVAENNDNIYFLFLNTQLFCNPRKNIIFIRGLSEVADKTRFINTCDAMLHARKEGESFGIAIAEFSVLKKPVITWKRTQEIKVDVEHTHHIDVLGQTGIYYSNRNDLLNILTNFTPTNNDSLDCYSKIYSPQVVMNLFNKYIIQQTNSVYNFISTQEFNRIKYTYFDRDDVAKSLQKNGWEPHVYTTIKHLLKPGDTFVDIGSNIGYHTLKVASNPNIKVISIEPQKDIFSLLEHNVRINNLKNVICLNMGLSDIERTRYIPRLLFNNSNMGDIPTYDNYKPNTDPLLCVDMDYLFLENNNINVIKIDVSGNELDIVKGGVKLLLKHRPYVIIPLEAYTYKRNGYDCGTIKNLFNALKYSMIEINSDYPCDHLCYPKEKQHEIEKIFGKYIQDNTVHNLINDNLSIGITKTIKYITNGNIRVKLMCNWTSSEDLCKCWNKMSKGNCKWNNIQVVYDDNNIDYYVIINKPQPNDKYIPEKTIVFRMEPDTETSSRWNDWYNSKDEFMYFMDLSKFRNNSEWHLGLSYNDIDKTFENSSGASSSRTNFENSFGASFGNQSFEKTKILSTVVSSLYNMEGHKKRIDFIKYLQQNKVHIDVYGRDNIFNLENHKGELPYHNKNDGILPYKYTFIAENCSINNYFTEKILDSIIGESVCFYWGCPNVENFIDNKAFIRLDLDDFPGSLKTVEEAIKNNEWEKRINVIREEKKKIINHYSFFPRIEGLIRLKDMNCLVVNNYENKWESFKREADRVGFKRYTKFSDKDNVWKFIKKDTLILRDDTIFLDNFIDYLAMIYNYIKNENLDFDVIFINYQNKDNKLPSINKDKIILYIDTEIPINYDMFKTYNYIVSSQGAKKILDYDITKKINIYCSFENLSLTN